MYTEQYRETREKQMFVETCNCDLLDASSAFFRLFLVTYSLFGIVWRGQRVEAESVNLRTDIG